MSEDGDAPDARSFEARLRAADGRRQVDRVPAANQTDASALSVGLRVGVELLSALVVAVAIGWGLDRWLHTMPLFLVVFLLLGGVAGVLNLWRTLAPARIPR